MGKVIFKDPIESISGKISKRESTIYYRRSAPTANPEMLANPNYSGTYGKRSTLPTASEIAQRTRFGNVCKACQTRLKDPSKTQQDLANFKKQNEYKTLRQFVWHACSDELE